MEDAVVTVNHLVVGGGKDAAVERACLRAVKSALGWPWPGT